MTKAVSIVFVVILFAARLPAQQVIAGQSKAASERAGTAAAELTFDTLLSADSYEFYGEVRSVGQVVSAGGDFLEPLMKLGAAPKELRQLVRGGMKVGDQIGGYWPGRDDRPRYTER